MASPEAGVVREGAVAAAYALELSRKLAELSWVRLRALTKDGKAEAAAVSSGQKSLCITVLNRSWDMHDQAQALCVGLEKLAKPYSRDVEAAVASGLAAVEASVRAKSAREQLKLLDAAVNRLRWAGVRLGVVPKPSGSRIKP